MIGGMLKEFRDFALKGNVLDLAIAVILGGAFGKVVSSLTSDIILPPIGKLLGGVDFSGLAIKLGSENPVFIKYGSFINVCIDFIVVAFALFILIKAFNTVKKRMETEKPAAAPAGPTKDQQLLMEIRDLLAKR